LLALDGHALVGDRVVGHAQLRQGPARPGGPHRAPGGAGPLHRGTGRGARMTTVTELDLAARVLEWVRVLGGPGTEAEVLVERRALALTRFANSYIHQNVADSTTSVRLRLHRAGRTALGSTTLTITEALKDLVERTVAASRHTPADPGWPGLAPPA